jgi:hypothetical protein
MNVYLKRTLKMLIILIGIPTFVIVCMIELIIAIPMYILTGKCWQLSDKLLDKSFTYLP